MRYDSFISKLDGRLENLGVEYRMENRSQSKCDLIISFRGVDSNRFKEITDNISKLCKIIVKEDVIFVKDGGVLEFSSVKEYLDHFKGHLEYVKLRRLKKDEFDYLRELAFLEAKLKFLNFMVLKKRTNQEIVNFLSGFESWISQRLQRIEIIKLSSDHIKETESEIKAIKHKIQEVKRRVKDQEKKHKEITREIEKMGKIKLTKSLNTSLFEETQIGGIEIFQVEEEEEEIQSEIEEDEEEI